VNRPTINIDGSCFSSLEEFLKHFQTQAFTEPWGLNLDSFNDVLRGGLGTPDGGFVLVWKNHALSKSRLGYGETQRVLRGQLSTCHSTNVERVQLALERAEENEGDTVFDWLLEIIEVHGPGGSEQEDGVELSLQ
jgi:RNAse (barnase) inhibitor barstar